MKSDFKMNFIKLECDDEELYINIEEIAAVKRNNSYRKQDLNIEIYLKSGKHIIITNYEAINKLIEILEKHIIKEQ